MPCLVHTLSRHAQMTLCGGTLKVDRFWGRALLWILFLATIMLFWPDFDQGALPEQVYGLW